MKLTQEQLKNLEVFLSRVQLQGNEVPAFNDLLRALSTPDEIVNPVVQEEVKDKSKKK